MAEKEYIEREAVTNHLDSIIADEHCSDDYRKSAWAFNIFISKLPAADVIPEKHGKWENKLLSKNIIIVKCSVCESEFECNFMQYDYCPNCGARMDGNENDRAKID